MFLKTFVKSESGAVSVIVALCLTMLLGFAAMTMDFGRIAYAKQSLQTACDAAALAAAADLGAGHSVNAAPMAKEYCKANGFDPDDEDIEIQTTISGYTVKVTLTKKLKMGFSATFSQKERSVSASATAEATSIFGGCPYAMFAGRRIEDSGTGITITGNDITINGNIHSNSDISMSHAILGEGVVATAVRSTSPNTAGWNGNSIALDMPSFASFESALSSAPALVEYDGNIVKSSKTGFQELILDAIWRYTLQTGSASGYLYSGLMIHIKGNLTFNGHNSTSYVSSFPIILIVDGDIDLNGAPLTSSHDYPVCIMSKTGGITVNGGGERFCGILYAPSGDIVLNGNNAYFEGRIVAQNIRKAGGKIEVNYYDDSDRFLPRTKVHLIA